MDYNDSYLNFLTEEDTELLEDIAIKDSQKKKERYIIAVFNKPIWDMVLSKTTKKDAEKELSHLRKTAKENKTGEKYALFKQCPEYIERIA